MRIVFIEPAGKGGMIQYAYQLCRAMSDAGADVTLITEKSYELAALKPPFRVEPILDLWDPKPSGHISTSFVAVTFRKLRRITRALKYYREWLRVVGLVARLKPDVVLLGDIRFPFDLFPLMLLRRKSRLMADVCHNIRPFSAGGKSAGLFDRSRFREFFYRRIYRLFDVVFVHFDRHLEEFTSTFGIAPSRVGVIVMGNWEIFAELKRPGVDGSTIRKRLGLKPEEPVVLFFGTLSKYKGTDTLLESFPRVHRETGARLVLAGFPFHDFDVDAHRQVARQLGIEQAVIWLPEYIPSEELAAWMEIATVSPFPYRDVYQSAAIGVAQTFGVPIVASRVGAMLDVVDHERSGLLITPEDPNALADALIRLIKDPALARRLGDEAAKDSRGPFAWSTIAATMLKKLETTRR
jgi:glycosyltransferase involved in cell wall biosynthesis